MLRCYVSKERDLLSINNLKGLLEVNRIAVVPFLVAAYLSQWGFEHFPVWLSSYSIGMVFVFLVVVLVSLVLSLILFDLTLYVDYLVNVKLEKQVDVVCSVATVSLISFGILGFFPPPEFEGIAIPWHVAGGACGLYLLDVQRRTRQELEGKT